MVGNVDFALLALPLFVAFVDGRVAVAAVAATYEDLQSSSADVLVDTSAAGLDRDVTLHEHSVQVLGREYLRLEACRLPLGLLGTLEARILLGAFPEPFP